MPITWDSRLQTGLEELDGQHRTLVDTVNRILAVVGNGGHNRDELEGLLVFLRDFSLTHFQAEQELMVRCDYPGEAGHRRAHADLVDQLELVLAGYRAGTITLDAVTLEGLDAWLVRHIQDEDFRLADYALRAAAHT